MLAGGCERQGGRCAGMWATLPSHHSPLPRCPALQPSTASSHTSQGGHLPPNEHASTWGADAAALAAAQQHWAPFAAVVPAAAVAASPPSPPPAPAAADLAAAHNCPSVPVPMKPVRTSAVAAPSPRKRKQPAGNFAELRAELECGAGAGGGKAGRQMSLLLSAIDACERGTPGGQSTLRRHCLRMPAPRLLAAPAAVRVRTRTVRSPAHVRSPVCAPAATCAVAPPPDTPLEPREPQCSPSSPLAALPRASVFEGRPFSHSQRSGFRPLAAPHAQPVHAPAAANPAAQLKALLALKLALLQRRKAAGGVAAPSTKSAAAAALLEAVASGTLSAPPTPGSPESPMAADERRRMQLAQKLLMVRAALQARIARKRAAQSLAAPAADLPTPRLGGAPAAPAAAEARPAAPSFAAFQKRPKLSEAPPAAPTCAAFQLQPSGSG